MRKLLIFAASAAFALGALLASCAAQADTHAGVVAPDAAVAPATHRAPA